MSGRDHEPIAAFFPPIDRNLIRDLDRHLRGTALQERREDQERRDFQEHQALQDHRKEHRGLPEEEPRSLAMPAQSSAATQMSLPQLARPSTSEVLQAVQQAASSMASMTQRIQELESREAELDAINGQLREKLGEMLEIQRASENRARAEAERAKRAEGIAAQHLSRAQTLENDLEAALGDLHRIAEAITGTLAVQHHQ